jgi:hypothetical protein
MFNNFKPKHFLNLILLLLISGHLFAQKANENYFGKNYSDYEGCILRILDKEDRYFFNTFYTDIPQHRQDKNLVVNDKNKLINRIFSVDSVFIHTYKINPVDTEKGIFFKMIEEKTGQILFYKYDEMLDNRFVFEIISIKVTESMVLKDIERGVDKFTGEIAYRSPLYNNASIIKIINKGKIQYYLLLRISGESSVTYLNKGVIVLFTDGKKWQRPNEKVGLDYDDSFEYSAYILLTPQDLEIFQNKNIEAFRLNVYDQDITAIQSEKLKYYIRAIKKLK